MVGLLLRVPFFGKIVGKLFIPKIREMFEGMKIRDKYLYELIQAKKSELEKGLDSTDGQGFFHDRKFLTRERFQEEFHQKPENQKPETAIEKSSKKWVCKYKVVFRMYR